MEWWRSVGRFGHLLTPVLVQRAAQKLLCQSTVSPTQCHHVYYQVKREERGVSTLVPAQHMRRSTCRSGGGGRRRRKITMMMVVVMMRRKRTLVVRAMNVKRKRTQRQKVNHINPLTGSKRKSSKATGDDQPNNITNTNIEPKQFIPSFLSRHSCTWQKYFSLTQPPQQQRDFWLNFHCC